MAVATPVEPRNFVSVVPAAKKGKLGPIFFLNIRVMYILSVKKQETGQKTGKNSPKKVFFLVGLLFWGLFWVLKKALKVQRNLYGSATPHGGRHRQLNK